MVRFLSNSATLLALTSMLAPQVTRAQSGYESRHFTTSDGVELHYLEAGSGPTLVFVPGWTMPAWIWESQLEHFAANHRVVALDPRGQGRSEKATYGYHASRRGRDVCELLEHLGGDPAVVAGWSIAVSHVLHCAQDSGAERIRALVLVDHDLNFEGDPAEAFTGRFRSLQTEREEWTRTFVEIIHANPLSEEYLDALVDAALSMPTNAAAMSIANFILLGPTDLGPALESVDRPVLAVFSSLDWAIAAADEVREDWPDVQVEIIDGTSHALFVDKPEEFNRVFEDFVATLSEE